MANQPKHISLGFSPLLRTAEGPQIDAPRKFDFFDPSDPANDQRVAWIFQMPEAAQLSSAGFLFGGKNFTVPPSQAPKCRLSLCAVNDSGLPDTSNEKAYADVDAATLGAADFLFFSFQSAYLAQRGEMLALQLRPHSGTFNFDNYISVSRGVNGYGNLVNPYTRDFAVEDPLELVWKARPNLYPIFAVQSSSKTYGAPIKNLVSIGTPYTRLAMRFLVPGATGVTYQVAALRSQTGAVSGSGNAVNLRLWRAGARPLLQTNDFSGKFVPLHGSAWSQHRELFFKSPLQKLTVNTEYFIGIENPQNALFNCIEVAHESHMTAFAGGTEVYLAQYLTSSSSWDHLRRFRPCFDLVLGDSPPSSSSSSSSSSPSP